MQQDNQDYLKLGLKAGVEIHQQLDTAKLFCNCPSILRKDEPDFQIERELHAVAGETGEIDIAAAYEAEQAKKFIYQGYNDNTCLVELDEEPPHPINQEALEIAIQIALLLNAKILTTTQIMRKTVIDGSNTSGFQRTVLIARNGFVETPSGKVGIQSIALEEDACRIILQEKDKTIFRLDRLGIPLVEIATDPDIKNPEQAKQVALQIGEILRACKVRRGIGTIRQDVNMSIEGGKRIEIKGVQEPALIAKTIITEAKRQQELIKQGKSKPEVRKANPDGTTSFLRPLPGAARMYPETDLPLLKISKQLIDKIKKTLPKLKTEIRAELRKKGLSEELLKLILKQNKVEEFKALLKIINKPDLIAKTITLWPSEIAKKLNIKNIDKKLSVDIIETILHNLQKGKISENDVKPIMRDIALGKSMSEALKVEKPKIENLEEEILKIIKQKPGLSIKAYMGLIMQKFKGKINPKEAMEILRKIVKGG